MNKTIPAISIIIPMYNAEKYVSECLDSILAQTFTDYEVIVIDDCSTDNSCKIVENYLTKFAGKLKLIRSKVNSGSGAEPRNIGLRLSRGEYVFFMDDDDAILENAFEILYDTSKTFKADVVHSDKCFFAPDDTVTTDRNKLKLEIKSAVVNLKNSAYMSEKMEDRINQFVTGVMRWEPWSNLISRDFLIENDIEFPKLSIADDLIFYVMLLSSAKQIVNVSNSFYVWRQHPNSHAKRPLSVPETIHKRCADIFKGISAFDAFMNKSEFFLKNPEYKYKIFHFFAAHEFLQKITMYAQVPAYLTDGLIRRELDELGDITALTAFFFARMNILNVQLIRAQNLLRQQPKETQDFQRNNEIIQRQQAQIQQLQQQLRNVHDVFR